MKANEYIEKKLKELSSEFTEVKIRYEYRATTQSHIIEVIPLSFIKNNEAYLLKEATIEEEFEKLFPMEDIIFISEDSLTEIRKAELELGYDKIFFNASDSIIEFVVIGYSDSIIQPNHEDFALAA
jgi:hypothetical protein